MVEGLFENIINKTEISKIDPELFLDCLEVDDFIKLDMNKHGEIISPYQNNSRFPSQSVIYPSRILRGEYSCSKIDIEKIKEEVRYNLSYIYPRANAFHLSPFKARDLFEDPLLDPSSEYTPSFMNIITNLGKGPRFHVLLNPYNITL